MEQLNFLRKSIDKFNLKDFDCVILVTSDRFYEDDLYLIKQMADLGKPIYVTRTKLDQSVQAGKRREVTAEETYKVISDDIHKHLSGYETRGIYLISSWEPTQYDLNKLMNDISTSLDDVKRLRFIQDISITSELILEAKRKHIKKQIMKYSALSAANALNPIPGVDIAVDVGFLVKMSNVIQKTYGIDEKQMSYMTRMIGGSNDSSSFIIKQANKYITKYGGKEAIVTLLKRQVPKLATKEGSKWVPIVGQVIAGSIGFGICKLAGEAMLKDAEKIAYELFEEMKRQA